MPVVSMAVRASRAAGRLIPAVAAMTAVVVVVAPLGWAVVARRGRPLRGCRGRGRH